MTMGELTNGGRERAYRALHDSEELHRVTLSSISDAVFLTDDDGFFTFICPNVDVIFGYVPDEVQAMARISLLLGENLFDRADLVARGEIRNIERDVTSKSGEHRSLLIHLKRVSIKGGTVLYSCRDVTDRRHAEEELRAVRQELAHASRLALLGELMASIGHEVNQPLAAIRSNASAGLYLLDREARTDDPAELRDIFVDIQDQSRLAADVIERLRALAGKHPLNPESLDVNEVTSDMLRLVAGDVRRRRVTLHSELLPSLPAITADRVCLQQVVLNLVLNAMDAMDQVETGERQLRVQTRRVEGAVEVSVSDTGRGIPADRLPRLFDAFFTTKERGLGLGLSIARSLVEAHGGRIWAEDHAGRGATFHVTLPVTASV
jgi:PAS domain S-box-containing protein